MIGARGDAPDREAVRRALTGLDGTNVLRGGSGRVERSRVRFLEE